MSFFSASSSEHNMFSGPRSSAAQAHPGLPSTKTFFRDGIVKASHWAPEGALKDTSCLLSVFHLKRADWSDILSHKSSSSHLNKKKERS